MPDALKDISAERIRQIEKEGWTPQADDSRYLGGELAAAGTCYAMNAAHELSPEAVDFDIQGCAAARPLDLRVFSACDVHAPKHPWIDPDGEAPAEWPFHTSWWKPRSPREDLVRAGALIAAEIDRIDRHAALVAAAKPEGEAS